MIRTLAPHEQGRHLRDTFAQRLLDKEVRVAVIESLMGHSSKSTTLRHYADVPWQHKVEAISRLSYEEDG